MIVLAGKNNIAVNALNFLRKNYEEQICIVGNRTDTGVHGWQRSLRLTAQELGVKELDLDEAYTSADLFISLEFDQIVDPEKFVQARAINLHFSLLPKYKGMYTSVWPILNGEVRTGVTLHEIDWGIDTGAIIAQRGFDIKPADRARDVYKNYLKNGFDLFSENIDDVIYGKYAKIAQSSDTSTYFSKKSLNFSSIEVDLNQTAYLIRRQIHAYSFREYQLPIIHGERVVGADILSERSCVRPGVVIDKGDWYFVISTIDFNLKIYVDRISEINDFSDCDIPHAKELLNGLCGVHDRNERGWSPIIIAAFHGNEEVVKYLLSVGADINSTNVNGTSVLMYAKEHAIKTGRRGVFDLLLAYGADMGHMDFSGKRLIDYLSLEDAKSLGLDS